MISISTISTDLCIHCRDDEDYYSYYDNENAKGNFYHDTA